MAYLYGPPGYGFIFNILYFNTFWRYVYTFDFLNDFTFGTELIQSSLNDGSLL